QGQGVEVSIVLIVRGLIHPDDHRHGTTNAYANLGCRCEACRNAWAADHSDWTHRSGMHLPSKMTRALITKEAEAKDNHGTESRYKRGCRCEVCRAGATAARRRRRQRAKDGPSPRGRAFFFALCRDLSNKPCARPTGLSDFEHEHTDGNAQQR